MTANPPLPRQPLQLWLTFDWPAPTAPTRVTCTGCRWTGRRAHRTAERRPCPKCAGRVVRAGDLRLAARVRYCQARQFQHLRHNRDALDTVRLARAELGSASTPGISAMLYGAEAASLAALGQRIDALDTLKYATADFERIDPDREPDWMRFFDRGEVLAQYGRVYRDLARADNRYGPDAVNWVTSAIGAFGTQNIRSGVLNEVGLCSALFLAHEPHEAVTVGVRVIEHAGQLTSRRIFDRIENLRRDLAGSLDNAEVADFNHALALTGRKS